MKKYRLKKLLNGSYTIEFKWLFFWVTAFRENYWGSKPGPRQFTYKDAMHQMNVMIHQDKEDRDFRNSEKRFRPSYLYPPLPDKEP